MTEQSDAVASGTGVPGEWCPTCANQETWGSCSVHPAEPPFKPGDPKTAADCLARGAAEAYEGAFRAALTEATEILEIPGSPNLCDVPRVLREMKEDGRLLDRKPDKRQLVGYTDGRAPHYIGGDPDPRLELAEAALALISEGHQDPAGLASHVLELSGQLGRDRG